MKKVSFFFCLILCILIFQPFKAIASVWLPKTLSYDLPIPNSADGNIDTVTFFTYYDDCFTNTVKTDGDNDGVIDEAGYYTFDHIGRIGRLDRDTDYDGIIDEYSIAYGGEGIGELGDLYFRDHYTDRDFTGDRIESYDGAGNLVSITRCTSYDANGYCLKEETDDGPDGVVDGISYHAFNVNKKIIKLEKDDDADGAIDQIHHYAYHENGNIMKEEHFAYEEGDAGVKVESIFTWVFDSKGNPVTMNSTIETVMLPFSESTTTNDCEWANTYDSNGNLVEAIDECKNKTIIVGPTGDIQTITSTSQQAMYLEWVRCDDNGTIDPGELGDLNGSGEADLADVVLILKILAGDESVEIVNSFDISGDERIGLEEALFILRKLSNP